jgi:hypothetical protein
MKKLIIQITAGKGPLECCRVVAKSAGFDAETGIRPGVTPGGN